MALSRFCDNEKNGGGLVANKPSGEKNGQMSGQVSGQMARPNEWRASCGAHRVASAFAVNNKLRV